MRRPPPTPRRHNRSGLEVPLVVTTEDFNELTPEACETKIREAKEIFDRRKAELGIGMPNDGMVWIASKVAEETFRRIVASCKGRFLFRDGNLYLRKRGGKCHSRVHCDVVLNIGWWRDQNKLSYPKTSLGIAAMGEYGDTKCEPDAELCIGKDGTDILRVLFEIEVEHRSTPQSLNQVGRYFRNPSVAAVVLLKVWPRGADGRFAAAAVVWEKQKPDDDDGTTIRCVDCQDFGTRPIHYRDVKNFLKVQPTRFAVGVEFRTPNRRLPLEERARQCLVIPRGVLQRNTKIHRGNPLAGVEIDDLWLDLTACAAVIERSLSRPDANHQIDDVQLCG